MTSPFLGHLRSPGSIAVSMVLLSATVSLAQTTTPASAQGVSDARWAMWLGCWQLVDESVQDPETFTTPPSHPERSRANAGALVCVTPSADRGATMTTLVNGKVVLTETIVADGSRTALSEPDCQGWHRAEWSPLAARLYSEAEVSCSTQPQRKVSGLSMMIAGPSWIDVQMIESESRKYLRVRRYFRAADQTHAAGVTPPRQATAAPLGSRMTIADVKEASGKVAPETLQAAIVELGRGFDLNSQRLIELDQAGVPDSVIDLMVALSYPKRFVVERRSSSVSSSAWAGGWFGTGAFDGLWPYYAHPYFYTTYYAPFGYRYWGFYDPYYFQGPGFVVVNPESPGLQPSGSGKVVDGFGYTRVRRNDPAPPPRADGSTGGFGTMSTGGNSGSSGSNSGVSSSGYSSGGGGGDSGRTAQPRPPGQ